MIVFGEMNAMGNVLHIVVGPETEIFMDVHGAAVAEIASVLNHMDADKPVFICFTKCRSEQKLQEFLAESGARQPHAAKNPIAGLQLGAKETQIGKTGVCSLCGVETELMPFEHVYVCPTCAQIELGRAKGKTTKHANENQQAKL